MVQNPHYTGDTDSIVALAWVVMREQTRRTIIDKKIAQNGQQCFLSDAMQVRR